MWSLSKQPYPYPDAQAQVKRLYDKFGAKRLMWGTDWPISLKQLPYEKAVSCFAIIWICLLRKTGNGFSRRPSGRSGRSDRIGSYGPPGIDIGADDLRSGAGATPVRFAAAASFFFTEEGRFISGTLLAGRYRIVGAPDRVEWARSTAPQT